MQEFDQAVATTVLYCGLAISVIPTDINLSWWQRWQGSESCHPWGSPVILQWPLSFIDDYRTVAQMTNPGVT